MTEESVQVENAFATRLSEKKAFSHDASERMVWLGRLLYAHIVYEPDAVGSYYVSATLVVESGRSHLVPALVNERAMGKSTIQIFLPQTTQHR